MSVASKNLFDLLGNDDPDAETKTGPVKTVDKTSTHTTKRNVEPQAPAQPAGSGVRRPGPGGSEGAFRDRNAGSFNNHRRGTDEPPRGGPRGGRGARERGGRGARFSKDNSERHTPKHLPGGGSDKQAAQSWGAAEGSAEQKDEQAGEEIAQSEIKEAVAEDAEANAEPAEPEDKSVSYADYLAQQAEKKLALAGGLEIRKPNEGSKVDKKWASAKALPKEEDEDFIAGNAGKAKRERERKTKVLVDIDQRYVEPERPQRGGRGGSRGGPRGGAGAPRGGAGARGDRDGARGGRGGRGRGDFRGGNAGGARGGAREAAANINTSDESAFPSLGA